MDLVRPGLERSETARQAVEVITGLLEQHGQGGDCGHLGRSYYDNGFIIADPHEAFVLETAGRWWAVEQVSGHRALSNAYSIGRNYDAMSRGLAAHARSEGWKTDIFGRFDLAAELIDEARDAASFGRGRCARGNALLDRAGRRLTPAGAMAILRDHGDDADWSPANTRGRTICMHAAQGPRRSQSVASMVSELRAEHAIHWVTATAAPCISLFKPVLFETGLPPQDLAPNDWFDDAALWWRHERLHRAMLRDFTACLAAIEDERDALEAGFQGMIDQAFDTGPQALPHAVAECWREAEAAEDRWLTALTPLRPAPRSAHQRSWSRLNQVAGLPRT
jgi:dipeptidase